MGFLSYSLAGCGFLLIGAWEVLSSSLDRINTKSTGTIIPKPSFLTSISTSLLSLLFISNSLLSLIDASNSPDPIGTVIQLQVISISLLFLLYSTLGLTNLPSPILTLICLLAFIEEFLLFYLQRKDPSGIENRYFDLLLIPITICICSTMMELKIPNWNVPRFARGIGLIFQGTWFVQMGVSFFTDSVAHGCFVGQKSRGNFTVRCKGHSDYHRGRALATLQFNCHIVFLVVILTGVYSILISNRRGFNEYEPIREELQMTDRHTRFTLDSDEDDINNNIDNDPTVEESANVKLEVNGLSFYQ